MVVKVVKGPGTFEQTCSSCRAELEASLEDLKCDTFGQGYREDPIESAFFVCPVCSSDVIVPNLPWSLKERLPRRLPRKEKT